MGKIAQVHIEMVKEKTVDCEIQALSSPVLAAEFGRSLYFKEDGNTVKSSTREIFTICCVDKKGNILTVEKAFVGTSSGTYVGMKELFMGAILCNAAEIICFHNHPSGDPNPSMEDNLITKKIREAGAILDIPMRDHIILGENGYYSYEETSVSEWRDSRNEKAG